MAYLGSASINEYCDSSQLEIERFHSDNRGDRSVVDARISRPAGVVSARENNSREIATFVGRECLRKANSR